MRHTPPVSITQFWETSHILTVQTMNDCGHGFPGCIRHHYNPTGSSFLCNYFSISPDAKEPSLILHLCFYILIFFISERHSECRTPLNNYGNSLLLLLFIIKARWL